MAEQTPQLPSSSVPFVGDRGNINPQWQRVLQNFGYSEIPKSGIVLMDANIALSLPKSWEIFDIGTPPPFGYVYIKRVS